MSNQARSALRTILRIYLNEASASFWEDADLNQFLFQAFQKYYREFLRYNTEQGKKYVDVTYTAAAEYCDVTTSGYTIDKVDVVEDRTSSQPGTPVARAESLAHIIDAQNSYDVSTMTAPYIWYLEKRESISSGAISILQRLYLAPKPSSAVSLRIHYQGHPDFTADLHTTGLPDCVEDCIIFQACIYARMKEPADFSQFQAMLEQAELTMKQQVSHISAGPMRVEYIDDNDDL